MKRSAFSLPPSACRRSRAFSLLELLAVIAVIGILAALIFPSVGAARKSANRAKTKVQFSQWAAAIESFRSEYGYYPTFHATNLVNGGAAIAPSGEHVFHDILAGKRRDGTALPAFANGTPLRSAEAQNRKRVTFYSFSEAEFTSSNLIADAFGNTSIAILVDRNLDGRIDAADYGTLPAVSCADGSLITPSSGSVDADVPLTGIRSGVVFYCADPNATGNSPLFVFSWK